MLKLIWCQTLNGGISKNNKLPWYIKEELDHFYKTTKNHKIIMGKNTFDSLDQKPLNNRTNIIFSSIMQTPEDESYFVTNNFQQVLNDAKKEDIFIIGGKELFDIFLAYADVLIVSVLKDYYDCDLYMKVDYNNFNLDKQDVHDNFVVNYYSNKKEK
ncbi:dihydrofolate reductase [Ureaplasma parvum]|uniref:dihydrofolate reductase n=1 Tax=Ureaplasma parvum TaxID=134821 RepID=UPI0026F33694|nr:dihydrofolate reductase [Ureaplasma parvum]